jgi:hypothetical protein
VNRVGIWPTAGIFYYHVTGGGRPTRNDVNLELLAPVMVHVAPHFFLGLGPSFAYEFRSYNNVYYGFDFLIGGWI